MSESKRCSTCYGVGAVSPDGSNGESEWHPCPECGEFDPNEGEPFSMLEALTVAAMSDEAKDPFAAGWACAVVRCALRQPERSSVDKDSVWIIVNEPNRVPFRKRPMNNTPEAIESMLVSLYEHYPNATCTIIRMKDDGPEPESGREWLTIHQRARESR